MLGTTQEAERKLTTHNFFTSGWVLVNRSFSFPKFLMNYFLVAKMVEMSRKSYTEIGSRTGALLVMSL
jgi:hypothetical protein